MKKILHKLCVLVALFAVSTAASFAQTVFSKTVTADYDEAFTPTRVSFPLTDLATALDTDTATLAAQLDEFINNKSGDLDFNLIYGEGKYDGKTQTSAVGGGGFWMTQNGDRIDYAADGCVWFTELEYSVEDNVFTFRCGQYPERTSGLTCHANYEMSYNGKDANFEITYIVSSKVEIIPNEKMTFSGLTEAGSADLTISVPQTTSSQAKTYGFEVKDIADKLGVDKDQLVKYFEKFMFVRYYDEGNSEMKDSINGGYSYTANGNGYYWSQLMDENTGKVTEECYSSYATTEAVIYTYGYTYTGDSLYLNLGQYQGQAKENGTYKATVYICNNEAQYYALNLTVNVTKSEALPFSQMTCAGVYTDNVTIVPGYTAAVTRTIPSNIVEEIAELTGVANGDAHFYTYTDSLKTAITDSYSANAGFWYGKDGYIGNYGDEDAAMYIEWVTANNYSSFNVGQYIKTAIENGDSTTAAMLVVGEKSYYVLQFTLKVKDTVGERENWQIVATQEFDVQLVASQPAQVDTKGNVYKTILDWTGIKETLGMTAVTANDIYTWKSYQEEWVPDSLTNSNSCYGFGTGNGFWMSKDGRERANWSDSCAYAIYIQDVATDTASICYWMFDGAQKANTSTDTAYVAEIFVINSNNGSAYKLVLNITFVNDPSERTTQVVPVGSEKQTLIIRSDSWNDEAEGYGASFDLTNALTALGITEDEVMSCTWRVRNAAGRYAAAEGFAEMQATVFNANGEMVADDAEDQTYTIWYNEDTKQLCIYFLQNDGAYPAEDFACTIHVQMVYDTQSYGFNITLGSSEEAVGIQSVSNDVKASKGIYTLAGQRVSNASKGLYIINGKKVLVK